MKRLEKLAVCASVQECNRSPEITEYIETARQQADAIIEFIQGDEQSEKTIEMLAVSEELR
jgi:hypothetical protein